MALDPVEAAFRNLRPPEVEPVDLPAWSPTGAPDQESVNRFRQAMGDIGDVSPADRVWNMVQGWSDSVRVHTDQLTDKLRSNAKSMDMVTLLDMQIQVHKINMTQNLMAKAGSSVYDATNSLLRGQ